MIPISLSDTITVEKIPGDAIECTCSDASLPTDDKNLAVRAVRLFRERFGVKDGVRLHLEKRIPAGAGLGGGSGNAAKTLLLLRKMCSVDASDVALSEICAQIGSDVAFFLSPGAAMCRGRGEIVEPLDWRPTLPGGFLALPGFGVPTPWAYQTYARNPRRGVSGKSLNGVELYNDLEPPVFEKYTWIADAKAWLQRQPETWDALMTGSGAGVFVLVEAMDRVPALQARFAEEFGPEIFTTPFTFVLPEQKG